MSTSLGHNMFAMEYYRKNIRTKLHFHATSINLPHTKHIMENLEHLPVHNNVICASILATFITRAIPISLICHGFMMFTILKPSLWLTNW
ncbi:hypothetical protein ACJX0J_006011, partial [Zea mays]